MVRMPGAWSSFDHLEECLTLDELTLLLSRHSSMISQDREFLAAINQIDLGDSSRNDSNNMSSEDRFEAIKARANAKARGMDEEEMSLLDMGIEVETY